LIGASNQETTLEIQRNKGVAAKFIPTPAQITALSFWILTIGGMIAAITASIRINQLNQKNKFGHSKGDLLPGYLIFGGTWVLFFGLLGIAIGSQLAAEQEEQITIF
jgi:hypothetical protein